MPATLHFDWDLPEGALQQPFAQDLVDTIKREATLRLFAEGKISSGYAAKMPGMRARNFLISRANATSRSQHTGRAI
jgi:hypothetical protein